MRTETLAGCGAPPRGQGPRQRRRAPGDRVERRRQRHLAQHRRHHGPGEGARANLEHGVPRATGAHLLALPDARVARPDPGPVRPRLARDRAGHAAVRAAALLRARVRDDEHRGTVTWRINKGLLVAPQGRGKGFLRIAVERRDDPSTARSSCASSPRWRTSIRCSRAGAGGSGSAAVIYRMTQYTIHNIVTNAFFRSLAKLDLAESKVGRFRVEAAGRGRSVRPATAGRPGRARPAGARKPRSRPDADARSASRLARR